MGREIRPFLHLHASQPRPHHSASRGFVAVYRISHIAGNRETPQAETCQSCRHMNYVNQLYIYRYKKGDLYGTYKGTVGFRLEIS